MVLFLKRLHKVHFSKVKQDEKKISSVCIKVPAKLIVSGEHSVIYNGRAVICAVDLYLTIKMKKMYSQEIIIDDNGRENYYLLKDFAIERKNENPLLEIVRRFFDREKISLCGLKISIKNGIPLNYGLGSSSSLTTGILFGLNKLFGCKLKTNDLITLATNIENIFHGKSSGADIQAVVKGGVLSIKDGNGEKIPHQIDEIWVISTGRPSFSTKNVVYDVVDRFGSSNKIWNEFYEVTDDIAEIMSSTEKLNQKVAHNESLLEKIGIVPSNVVSFIKEIKTNDIYAKVCGAGTIAEKEKNGGCGIVSIFQTLDKEQIKFLANVCKKYKFKLSKIRVANEGLSIKIK